MASFKNFILFIQDLIKSRALIWQLTKKDFKSNHLGTHLGIVWAFIQPITTILVLWFVFSVGFKVGNTAKGVPFILWLVTGMIPWFFFSEAINQGTGSIIAYSYLVKKVVFRVSVLPIIKILSSLFVHSVLVVVMLLLLLIYGFSPTIYWLQIPYFVVCTFFLVLGTSWLTASLNVFTKDIGQIINVLLQLGFWATPIFWDFSMVEKNSSLATFLKLNPAFYIVSGYRDSLIYNDLFWEDHLIWTVYFWCFTFLVFAIGAFVFKKLKPHFADVL